MKIAYFDCFSGISGDMCLGALVDVGLPLSDLAKALKGLHLPGYSLRCRHVTRGGIRATKVDVVIEKGRDRSMAPREIQRLLKVAALSPEVRERASAVFERLAEAEAVAHHTTLSKVHFHELGSIDSLVDVVGTVLACHLLGIEGIYASAINVGSGTTRSEHGILPAPGPATANLLKGLPIYNAGPARELTTPTGAVLIATLARGIGAMPHMNLSMVGYGAGTFDSAEWPNVLRVFIGETASPEESDTVVVLETNLDDMNPQVYEVVMDRLMAQGALDVTLTPVIMKRGRPGIVLTVLADPAKLEPILRVLFAETTTLGVRVQETSRRLLPREITEVSTRYGPVRVKIAKGARGGRVLKARPEYRDCRRIAEQTGLPLRGVLRDVERDFQHVLRKRT